MIRILKQKIKKEIGLLSCVLFILFIFACGGDYIENQVPSSESGSIAFTIEWTEPSISQDNNLSIYREKPDPLDCQAVGIVDIEAEVYDAHDNYLVSGGPWDCSLHSGIIDNIPAGLNRKIVILAYDSNGNIKYRGEATGITIRCGQTTDVGVIQATFIDYSGIWYLTERVIESVGECPEDIGRQNNYSVQLELMADGNADLNMLYHPEKSDLSDKTFTGKFKDNQLIVSSDGIAYNCEPECSGTSCYNGQLAIDLTFSINENATGTMRVDSCCGDGGYTIWSINAKRYITFIDYYPLKIGNKWYYQGLYDDKEIEWLEYVSNQVTINENTAMKIEEEGRGNSPDYSWIDPNGFMHFGFDEEGHEIRYDPPVYLPGKLIIGQFYQGNSDLFTDGNRIGKNVWSIMVEGLQRVATPAGVFNDCLKISINSEYLYDSNSSNYNDNLIIWYARGIGEVRREDTVDGTYGELLWAIVDGKTYGATTDLAGNYLDTSSFTFCGNKVVETGEECDGTTLPVTSCAALQSDIFDTGTLSCRSDCMYDKTNCSKCGDGKITGDEECDGANFGGVTCRTLGHEGGTLTCTNCQIDDGSCTDCGDLSVEPPEDCDPPTSNLMEPSCADIGKGDGPLGCNEDCTYDVSACYRCGDGIINGSEDCDGINLGGKTCADFEWDSSGHPGEYYEAGTLKCDMQDVQCTFDLDECRACGNNIVESGEDCEPNVAIIQTCADLEYAPGNNYDGGTLACNMASPDACTYDKTGCTECGDGTVTAPEQCETGQTADCGSFGYQPQPAGVSCVLCRWDTSACQELSMCGDGVRDEGEQCDNLDFGMPPLACVDLGFDGGTIGAECNEDCMVDTSGCTTCDNGVLEPPEVCDVGQLGGQTCQTQGFAGGNLACNATCDGFDASGCVECFSCRDCNNQACIDGQCGNCRSNADCCAPYMCVGAPNGRCMVF
jgi:hypothetical protein